MRFLLRTTSKKMSTCLGFVGHAPAISVSPRRITTCGTRNRSFAKVDWRRVTTSRPHTMWKIGMSASSASSASAAGTVTSSHPGHASISSAMATGQPKRLRVRRILEASKEDIVDKRVTVGGWVRTVRDQKNFAFINVNDGSNVNGIQLVVDGASPVYESVVKNLATGCSVSVVGKVVESLGKNQTYELQVEDMRILGDAPESYPLQKKRHSLEFLRTIAHLRPRTNSISAMARVRSTLAQAIHRFFAERDFVYVHTPIITASDCEGAGEMFRVTTLMPEKANVTEIPRVKLGDKTSKDAPLSDQVDFAEDFFGKSSFLTVSGQLGGEAYACAMSDVYTFGPTFRAENSNTTRHLAEFWMIEPEMAFAELEEVMENAESMVKFAVQTVVNQCKSDLDFFESFVSKGLLDKLQGTLAQPFGRVSYTEAIEILQKAMKEKKAKFEYKPEWGNDLQTEHERFLAETHFQRPVFVYNYPSHIKSFYMKANDFDNGKTVAATDLLVPGIGELIGGSQREHRLDILEQKMDTLGLDKASYWWYLDLRRFGSVPHGGYGLGFERLVQYVTGIENIRDVIPFPRYPGNAEF